MIGTMIGKVHFRIVSALLLGSILAVGLPAVAQSFRGTIRGKVTDPNGNLIDTRWTRMWR